MLTERAGWATCLPLCFPRVAIQRPGRAPLRAAVFCVTTAGDAASAPAAADVLAAIARSGAGAPLPSA